MWSVDLCYCFFFSSRRRHTRFDCDWSSDVCSSDLLHRLPHESNDCDRSRSQSRKRNRQLRAMRPDRKSTRLNSSHSQISYAVFCLKKKKTETKLGPATSSLVTSDPCMRQLLPHLSI